MSIWDIITQPLAEVGTAAVDLVDEQKVMRPHTCTRTHNCVHLYAFMCTGAGTFTESLRVRVLDRFLITCLYVMFLYV